jgi:trk system potassium uptake protein
LWLQWIPQFGVAEAAWHAVFHAISAFCNAGFSTFSTSMTPFQARPGILVSVSLLIILGGIGYLTFEELVRWTRTRRAPRKLRLSLQSTAVVVVTGGLLLSGAILFAYFEWNGALSGLHPIDRVANAWFMSATSRTAGFNSVSYGAVTNASAFLTILLMVVGGSPGSTAGGLKTTTFGVLLALAVARMRGRRFVEFRGRTIPRGTTERTVSLALLAFAVMTLCIFLLMVAETATADVPQARQAFLPLFFEVVSAFCTVGLSMDLTPHLHAFGKGLIIALMFVGRVGPLAFFAAITLQARSHDQTWRNAEEDLIVG